MSLWQYKAIPLSPTSTAPPSTGRLAGESGAEIRHTLRKVGLQVIHLKRLGHPTAGEPCQSLWRAGWAAHIRKRRVPARAELFDSLATLLESGVSLPESVQVLLKAQTQSHSATGQALLRLKEALRAGQALSAAMGDDPHWFDPTEVAMVEAGQHGGTLPRVLRVLSDRHERSGQLSHKLVAALAYPLLVSLLGLGVVVFLSTKTLPELVQILVDAGVDVPALTVHVMAVGTFLSESGPWLLIGLLILGLSALVVPTVWSRAHTSNNTRCPRYLPQLVRKMRTGALASGLAELLRSGVPMVEALHVLAPTAGFRTLRQMLLSAGQRLEHGVELSEAFREGGWFDEEFLRLLELGQSTGELPTLLDRIGHRYLRSAERKLDRLSAFLEPAAVMALAVLVGIVALAAMLPLFQLQEVL